MPDAKPDIAVITRELLRRTRLKGESLNSVSARLGQELGCTGKYLQMIANGAVANVGQALEHRIRRSHVRRKWRGAPTPRVTTRIYGEDGAAKARHIRERLTNQERANILYLAALEHGHD
jgi:hypothetical protein